MPFATDVHIDQALTNISIAYKNTGLVGDRVLPSVPVDKRSNRYFVYGKEQFKQRDNLVRPGGIAPEWERTLSQGFYVAERHAERQIITDDERRMSDVPLQPDADYTEFLTDSVMNQREFGILSAVTSTSNVTQNVTLSGTSQWSDYTNSTPLVNIKTAKVAVRLGVLREANMMTLSYEAALTLADHPSLKDLTKYTDSAGLNKSGLPTMVRGLQINEAGAFQDTANDGQAATFTTAFGKNALVHYTSPSVGLKSISFGYTFEAPDATTGTRGFATTKYREDARHGEWIEVSTTYALVLTAPLGAYLLLAVTA